MKIHRPHFAGTAAALAALAALAVLTTGGCAAWRIQQSIALARQSEPFQTSPAGSSATLLVVGDSTAVGTGATSPASSLAGLIARDHPNLKIVNLAKDGARFSDVVGQLETLDSMGSAGRFDVILVMGGGNDVIRMTRQQAMEQDIFRVAELARTHASLVVVMPCGNVGNAPFFFPPLSWLMSHRAAVLHRYVSEAAADNGAIYVNVYREKADDPFAQRPGELNAADGLHPADAGYLVWYNELNTQASLSRRLSDLEREGQTGGKTAP